MPPLEPARRKEAVEASGNAEVKAQIQKVARAAGVESGLNAVVNKLTKKRV